jgi:membrane protein DedA with SNARE-associated domain
LSHTARSDEDIGGWNHWRVIAGIALLVVVIGGMGLLVEHDASGQAPSADESIGDVLRHYGYLVGFALIYIEESGVPLFIPGDAFLLYVGHRLPPHLPILIAAWLGFTLAVTLGSTNLYLLSRRYGRRLLEHRIARFLHLTPEQLDRAEQWFAKWGPWTLIFGRHLPGFRVPLTVAAGVLKLRYPIFAVSVAVSAAAWAGIFLTLGVLFGTRIEDAIRSSPVWFAAGAVAVVAAAIGVWLFRRRQLHAARESKTSAPSET